MRGLLVTILLTAAYSAAEEVLKVSARDSYLDAYQETKSSNKANKAEKKSDNVYPVYSGPGQQFGPPETYYGPSHQYGPPSSQYGPPNSQYGPPTSQYGPPTPHYGPPPSYGTFAEPIPQYGPPVYGPPAQNLQVFYGVPHAMISIWDKVWEKIKWKLDVFTFGKILLKLVIFKKIISFIVILFLLLFIPSLKNKKGLLGDGEESGRSDDTNNIDERLNRLTSFVTGAIENYENMEKSNATSCDSTYCIIQKKLVKIEAKYSYDKLAEFYARENRID